MERCDRNLVWPNDLQVVWVVDGAGGVFDCDGAKKEAKKGVVHLLLGHFQGTITTTSVKWKLDITMTWQTKKKRLKQQSSKFLPSKTTLSWNQLTVYRDTYWENMIYSVSFLCCALNVDHKAELDLRYIALRLKVRRKERAAMERGSKDKAGVDSRWHDPFVSLCQEPHLLSLEGEESARFGTVVDMRK